MIIWVSLLTLGGLTFLALSTPPARQWMAASTGEATFAAQVKGLSDLMSDWLRPRLHLDPDTPIAHADLSPFGINVFLEQEVDPAKRALAVEMAADGGLRVAASRVPLGGY